MATSSRPAALVEYIGTSKKLLKYFEGRELRFAPSPDYRDAKGKPLRVETFPSEGEAIQWMSKYNYQGEPPNFRLCESVLSKHDQARFKLHTDPMEKRLRLAEREIKMLEERLRLLEQPEKS